MRRLVDTLAQRSREFQQLANAMPQMVFIADAEGEIEFLNQRACEYLGYEATESLPFSPGTVIHSEDRDRVKSRWTQSVEMQTPFHCEFRVLKAESQKFRWHLARAEPVHDDHGEIRAWYITCTDIHQRKLAEQKLSVALDKSTAASVAKSEFLANMSHEIRTPMTSILGYAELLSEKENDSEKIRLLQVIQQNGEFLVDIINDILDLSKIEAGKLEITFDEFEIRPFVEAIGTLFRERALEKNIEFDVQISDSIHDGIRTDAKRLRQILVNLIGNAIKFTDAGYVRLDVDRKGDDINFTVTDSGVGMESELVEKLFQPFQQGDASISRRFGGTGLGLAISHRLATMLGGGIQVESEPGNGSQFTLTLNAAASKGRFGSVLEPHEREDASFSEAPELHCRVLVVDDRRDVRFLTSSFLTSAGADVVDAENGLEAVKLVQSLTAERKCPDVILMDMQMPTMDGYEAASRLRSLGFENPIIALTADAMQGDMTRCIESGCNSYLSKPINRLELLRMVAGHLAR
ncbi:MAG: hypothetical protein CMJ46_07375 [Planctomyces sp.]|nr:hypothetical protein [Planctomyces sp.]